MSIFNIINLFGGLALFLYGMTVMSANLEKLSGSRLEKTLESFTNKTWKGVLLGLVVTGIIQSSSATTVIVVGLVNSGVMRLRQAIGVIMGANIGTTVTAQILRLGDISGDDFFIQIFKPSSLSPIVAVIGLILIILPKSSKKRSFGQILLGFAILFTGMMAMEAAVAPLKDSKMFAELFATLSNPILGVLAGAVVTAIIQSSSASVGILQALSTTGRITYSSAFPIIMGQNIGTCITAILASIGTNKNAKRAAMVHLYFNIIGTIVFLIGIYSIQSLIGFSFWNSVIDRGGIANFHTIFNIVMTILFFPFTSLLEKLANMTIRSKKDALDIQDEIVLDDRLLVTPALAIQRSKDVTLKMAKLAKINYELSIDMLHKFDKKTLENIRENENAIDKMEGLMGNYLLKLTDRELTEEDNMALSELLHLVTDFERIGDYSINIIEKAEEMRENGIIFSDEAYKELDAISDAIRETLDTTIKAFDTNSLSLAQVVEPLEETIDIMTDTLRTRHVDRLKEGRCNIEAGIIFIDILTNLERISDHCSTVAVFLIGNRQGMKGFDAHSYLKNLHAGAEKAYNEMYFQYKEKYYNRLFV